jgi:AI-2 transport protein TqsA
MGTIRRTPLLTSVLFVTGIVVIVAGMRAAASFLSPLLLAIFLAVLLYPAYQWLLDRGIPTWLAVSLMVVGVMLVGLGLLALIWLSLAQLRDNLFFYTTQLTAQRIRLEGWLASLGIETPSQLSQELLNRQMLLTTTARVITNLGSILVTGFFVLVATVFLLLQATHLSARLSRELGPDNQLQLQMVQVTQRIARFFAIRVRVNLLVAIGITAWLLILGVDLAILWGILAFFLSFVMYVGLATAAVPPVLLALAESGIWWAVLVVLGVMVINVGVENILAPAMMGQGLNLAPVVVLSSIVFWAWVLGPLGFILAIPLTVIVVMILASNPGTHWITVLLTMDSPPMVEPLMTPAPLTGEQAPAMSIRSSNEPKEPLLAPKGETP